MFSSKKLLFGLFCIFLLAGCDWFSNDPSTLNGIYLYKTKGDYRHLYEIRMVGDNIIGSEHLWSFYNPDELLSILNTDTIYNGRQKMANGYVLDDAAHYIEDVYLSLSYKDVLLKEIAINNVGKQLPNDTLRKYILDVDPYVEFYEAKNPALHLSDSLRINQIILDGEIDKYFERLK